MAINRYSGGRSDIGVDLQFVEFLKAQVKRLLPRFGPVAPDQVRAEADGPRQSRRGHGEVPRCVPDRMGVRAEVPVGWGSRRRVGAAAGFGRGGGVGGVSSPAW
ncbi:hypothetical protein JCM4914_31640 [Streptomyces platensis subsp. malvinus]